MRKSHYFIGTLSVISLIVSGCNLAPKNTYSSSSASVEYNFITVEALFNVDRGDVNQAVAAVKQRLEAFEAINYHVDLQDGEIIKVSLDAKTDFEKAFLIDYLTYNGSLALSNSKGTYALASEFLVSGRPAHYVMESAYFEVIIPINKNSDSFNAIYREALDMAYNNTGEVIVELEDGEEENEEHERTHKAFLYLWYNYIEGQYTYDKIDQNSPDTYDPTIASQVLMTFDVEDPFYDETHYDLRAFVFPRNDTQEMTNEEFNYCELLARYYVAIINAKPLDVEISYLSSESN